MIPIIWGDTKINILDTPGYFDFVGEAEEAAAAADAAIIVVNGKNGVEVGTEKAWDLCEKVQSPTHDSSMHPIWTSTTPASVKISGEADGAVTERRSHRSSLPDP